MNSFFFLNYYIYYLFFKFVNDAQASCSGILTLWIWVLAKVCSLSRIRSLKAHFEVHCGVWKWIQTSATYYIYIDIDTYLRPTQGKTIRNASLTANQAFGDVRTSRASSCGWRGLEITTALAAVESKTMISCHDWFFCMFVFFACLLVFGDTEPMELLCMSMKA